MPENTERHFHRDDVSCHHSNFFDEKEDTKKKDILKLTPINKYELFL